MKNLGLFVLAAQLGLSSGCFVEVDDRDVTFSAVCDGSAECTVAGVPEAVQTLEPLALMSGGMTYDIDLGEQALLKAENDLGIVRVQSELSLDSIIVRSRGAALDGIDHLKISLGNTTIATFDRNGTSSRDAHQIVLSGNPDINLIALGTKLSLRLEASGRVPTTDWPADIAVVASLHARAE